MLKKRYLFRIVSGAVDLEEVEHNTKFPQHPIHKSPI